MKSIGIQINDFHTPDFAYWVGVMQSDGYFKLQNHKKSGKTRYFVSLKIGEKSLPMQKKFIDISQKLFNVKGSMFSHLNASGNMVYEYKFGCKIYLDLFNVYLFYLILKD